LDPISNFECGFTNFIKKNYTKGDFIYLLEANKNNIPTLKKCWEKYPNVNIYNYAITTNNISNDIKKFYYSLDDAPYHQTCSVSIEHVLKHYPNKANIKEFQVEGISINNFIEQYIGNKIDYLEIDLEGIDYDVIMDLNLKKYNIENISIEFQHMGRVKIRSMIKKLNNAGYSYMGYGFDHNSLDFLFKRKKIKLNQYLSLILGFTRSKKIRHFINRILIKIN